MRSTDLTLDYLATRVGAGDHAAFRRLYAMLAPTTLATVRDDLPDTTHSVHVVHATFCEVWWMCEYDARTGIHRHDLSERVSAIADRRCVERCQTLALLARDVPPTRATAFWLSLMADRDVWTTCQLTGMLDGRSGRRLSFKPRRPGIHLGKTAIVGSRDASSVDLVPGAVRAGVRWRIPTQFRRVRSDFASPGSEGWRSRNQGAPRNDLGLGDALGMTDW